MQRSQCKGERSSRWVTNYSISDLDSQRSVSEQQSEILKAEKHVQEYLIWLFREVGCDGIQFCDVLLYVVSNTV